MANLSYLPLQDIGINGLNTQNHPSSLDPSWFTESENMIVNESARVGFRKGFEQKIRRLGTGVATKIGSIVEHLVGDDYKVFAAISNKIYTVDFTDPDTDLQVHSHIHQVLSQIGSLLTSINSCMVSKLERHLLIMTVQM